MLHINYKIQPSTMRYWNGQEYSEQQWEEIKAMLECMANDPLIKKYIRYNYFDTEDEVTERFNEFLENYRKDYVKYAGKFLMCYCDVEEAIPFEPMLYSNSAFMEIDTFQNWIIRMADCHEELAEQKELGEYLYCDNCYAYAIALIFNDPRFVRQTLLEYIDGEIDTICDLEELDDDVLVDYVNELGRYHAGRDYIKHEKRGYVDLYTNEVIESEDLRNYVVNLNNKDSMLKEKFWHVM